MLVGRDLQFSRASIFDIKTQEIKGLLQRELRIQSYKLDATNDEFIKSKEFKMFLYKVKKSELTLTLKPRESKEKTKELIEKLLTYDADSKKMIGKRPHTNKWNATCSWMGLGNNICAR